MLNESLLFFLKMIFIPSCALTQAFPQLPEDVLCVHADAVQRPSVAQYNPSDNSQSAARRGEEGYLEDAVAHHYRTHTGGYIHRNRVVFYSFT